MSYKSTNTYKFVIYIITILIIIFFAMPVQAARIAPGSVPNTKPLQPIPQGSAPNYSESVNTPPQEAQNINPTQQEPGQNQNQNSNNAAPETQKKSSNKPSLTVTIIIITLVAAASFLGWRQRKKEKQD